MWGTRQGSHPAGRTSPDPTPGAHGVSPRLPLAAVDVAVIGGGVVGLCLAWFLAEEGRGVVVIDDGRHSGTTTNAGSLHVQMQSRFIRLYPDLVAGLEAALPLYPLAVRVWEDVARRLDADIELHVSGGVMVAESREQFDFLATKCARERALGLDVAMLDRADLDRLAPYLGPAVVGAEWCATEGKVNPLLANQAIRRRALALGVVHRTEEQVTVIARAGAGFRLETTRGPIEAGRVVIAAGAGSAALGAMLGVPVPALAEPLHMNVTEPTAPLVKHLVQHADRQITLKQLTAGHVVIGGGWPARLAGPDRFPTVQPASLLGNVTLAQHVVPQIGRLRLLRTWAGINTTVDGRAVLGECAAALGVAFAIPGDAGYTLGPLCARIVADLVTGRAPVVDTAPYSPARFLGAR
jgi:glycine/D-amino acid oxidase-like deaminating enzyme